MMLPFTHHPNFTISYLFTNGPQSPNRLDSIIPVGEVADKVVAHWGNGSWVDLSDENAPHKAKLLSLDISKAKSYLKWFPVWNIDKTIEKTVDWYKEYKKKDPYRICVDQIEEFQAFSAYQLISSC